MRAFLHEAVDYAISVGVLFALIAAIGARFAGQSLGEIYAIAVSGGLGGFVVGFLFVFLYREFGHSRGSE